MPRGRRKNHREEVSIFHEHLMRSLEPHLEVKELLEEDLYKIITEKASRLVYCIGSAIFKNDTWLTDFIDKYDLLNHKAVLKLNAERKPKRIIPADSNKRSMYQIDLTLDDDEEEEKHEEIQSLQEEDIEVQRRRFICDQLYIMFVKKRERKIPNLPKSKPRIIDMKVYTFEDQQEYALKSSFDLTQNGNRVPDQPKYIGDDFEVPDRVMELYNKIVTTRDPKTFDEPSAHQLRIEMVEASILLEIDLRRFAMWQELTKARKRALKRMKKKAKLKKTARMRISRRLW